MVNKVAVIAIVAILAVPILIGFGMNLEPTTKTEYILDNNSTIVSPLLQNGVAYSYVHADYYNLNTNFSIPGVDSNTFEPVDQKVVPTFINTSSNISSYKITQVTRNNSLLSDFGFTGTDTIGGADCQYDQSTRNIKAVLTFNGDDSPTTFNYFQSFYWEKSVDIIYVAYGNGQTTVAAISDPILISFSTTGTGNYSMHYYYDRPSFNKYADFSSGYYFREGTPEDLWSINLPERTRSALITVNLDSDPGLGSYSMVFDTDPGPSFSLRKTTVSGEVKWQVRRGSTTIADLYYDPSRSDNTYQILFQFEKIRSNFDDTNTTEYNYHTEFRYVGGWPTLIGEANYYQKYTYDSTLTYPSSNPEVFLDVIKTGYYSYGKTLTMRVDDALYGGMEYPTINDKIYDPASFKSNPSTTLKNISVYGNSIQFGGQSFTVDSTGNIMLGTHKTSLNGIVLDSIPVSGGYDNRINGYKISTTAQPSTIKFVGSWSANISTDSQSTNTYQTTVWHAGEFAWDGIDTNFLIVGLITSLAVFIGLGIYARKSNSRGVIPLMIVCGGAAMLFFVLL